MRLEMTMSDSGPVPRNHSPLVWLRLSRFIRGFLLSKQIADAGGFFVGFRLDRVAEFLSQFHDFALPGRVPQAVPRDLAHVAAATMDAHQERFQGHLKDLVVQRAAKPAFRLELHIPYA